MATSSTQKKASTGTKKTTTAAKKQTAPKPKPVPAIEQTAAEPMNTTPAAPKTLQEFEHAAAVASRQAEQNFKKAMQEDERVSFQVPPDPRGEIVVFHRYMGGVEIKLTAGEFRDDLPRVLVNEIMKKMKLQILSDKRAERYTKDGGVDLTNLL